MSTGNMVQIDAARLRKLEEMERKAKLSARKASVKNLIYVEKAKAAGLTVTKEEVEARIAREDAVRAPEVDVTSESYTTPGLHY